MWTLGLLLCLTWAGQILCLKHFYSDVPASTAYAWSLDNMNKYSHKKGATSQIETDQQAESLSSSVEAQADLDSSSVWNVLGSELVLDKEALIGSSEDQAGLDALVWADLATGILDADLFAQADLAGDTKLDLIDMEIPAVEIDQSVSISGESSVLELDQVDTTAETQEEVSDSNKFAYFGFKPPKYEGIFSKGKSSKFPNFELPNLETVVLTDEEEAVSTLKLPDFQLPKLQKGPVKEVPVYVYKMPPWPEQPKLDLPKLETFKEVPLVLYEMAPLKEMEKFSVPKMPEIRIEKYILPPLPKVELPKLEAPKEIPIVMYEFPEVKPLDLPKIEPIKEIPIVTYELPKMKPLNLPKIKIPQIKVVRRKLPPLPELKMPKLGLNFPEIKVVKYQMPEVKPLELPKVPEIKFVKYEMPVPEKEKLPGIKFPELQPLKFPEMKFPKIELPEIKKMEIPEVPTFNFPAFPPMAMPPVQYVYAPVAVPMPYGRPFHYGYPGGIVNYGSGFGGKSKFETVVADRPPVIVNSGHGLGVEVDIEGHGKEVHLEAGKKPHVGLVGGGVNLFHQHGLYGYGDMFNVPSSVIVMTGNDAIVNGNEDVVQFFLAEGNDGLVLESSSQPWSAHHLEDVKNNPTLEWLKELYDGSMAIKKKTADLSGQPEGNFSLLNELI